LSEKIQAESKGQENKKNNPLHSATPHSIIGDKCSGDKIFSVILSLLTARLYCRKTQGLAAGEKTR
jgi:hypothetical protein